MGEQPYRAASAYVVLDGGPRDGWAYDAASIETQARAGLLGYTSRTWDYKPTGRIIRHRYVEKKTVTEVDAEVWIWTGER